MTAAMASPRKALLGVLRASFSPGFNGMKERVDWTSVKLAVGMVLGIAGVVFVYSHSLSPAMANDGGGIEGLGGDSLNVTEQLSKLGLSLGALSEGMNAPGGDNSTNSDQGSPAESPAQMPDLKMTAEAAPLEPAASAVAGSAVAENVVLQAADPGVDECAAPWQSEYAALHASAIARGRHLFEGHDIKYVLYDCSDYDQSRSLCGGLDEMLVGIVSTFVFALLSNRVFLIRAAAIEAAFESPHIKWRMPSDVSTQVPWFSGIREQRLYRYHLDETAYVTSLNTQDIDEENTAGVTAQLLIDLIQDRANVIVTRGNRGVMHEFLHANRPEIAQRMNAFGFFRPSQAFHCIMRYILQPTSLVNSVIEKQLAAMRAPNTFIIGVHARIGEVKEVSKETRVASKEVRRAVGRTLMKKHRHLFSCAEDLAQDMTPPGKKVVWFVSSDSPELKEEARALYGDTTIYTNFTSSNMTQRFETRQEMESVLKFTVGEWALFSECNVHIYPRDGLYTTSTLFSSNYANAYVFTPQKGNGNMGEEKAMVCKAGQPNPFDAEDQVLWTNV